MNVTIQKIKEIASCMTIFHLPLYTQEAENPGAKNGAEQLPKLRAILYMAKILMSIPIQEEFVHNSASHGYSLISQVFSPVLFLPALFSHLSELGSRDVMTLPHVAV